MTAIELTVVKDSSAPFRFKSVWANGTEDDSMVRQVFEEFLDLVPFMLARILVKQCYDPKRLLIVRLEGADYEMVRAPLGVVAATPLLNHAVPVTHPLMDFRVWEARSR